MIVATSPSATAPLALVELPSRPVGPADVRVRIRTIGVNPVDWKMRQGGPMRLAHRFVGPSGPLVVGVDFAGEIAEFGAEAGALPVGARVVGATDFSRKQLGSYADEAVVGADQVAALPDGVSFDHAACLGVPGATAMQALVDFAHLDQKPGGKVLVLGASGGVGLCAVQLARALGASVVGVCSTANVAVVESLGATVVDYTKGDALEAARPHGPFDLVLHTVGTGTYPLSPCRALLTPGGTVALVAVNPFADALAIAFTQGVHASLGRSTGALLAKLAAMVADGKLKCIVEAKLPLAEAEEAHVRSRRGKVVGKLLLAT
ncbi:MAG TPA: NAD(P)-dependent alcohol dehydrogenase [Polyangiaceae bacterium]|jgi:NADPH:quinone reductase-like Zn-dependent oxidoreductase